MSDRGDAEDYYAVLRVPPDASTAAIEAAYRDRVKETHPDLNDAQDATEQFQRVKRAKEVLTDPDERARYDRLGHERYVSERAGNSETGGRTRTSDAGSARSEDESAGAESQSRRQRARWTAEGWDDPGAAGTTASGGTSAGVGSGPTASHTASHATESGAEATAGVADSADLGDRITFAARALERYRFDIDPTTAVFGLATFFLYPVFLASSFAPEFPLAVNLILLCCLFCTVGYLLATPEVGLPVFGAWSLFGPVVFIFVDRPLLSWAGFFLVATTFVPFGLSLAILELLRLD
ncbi:MAG: DnaJ domain-containing protein [Haloglomus sp.]